MNSTATFSRVSSPVAAMIGRTLARYSPPTPAAAAPTFQAADVQNMTRDKAEASSGGVSPYLIAGGVVAVLAVGAVAYKLSKKKKR